MTLQPDSFVDLPTPSGPMRTHLFQPTGNGLHPSLILYSEIFQVTAPIRRLAAQMAGNGYLVAVPEVYHEFETPGSVLTYDQAGSDRGNALKYAKTLSSYDADTDAVTHYLKNHAGSTGAIGSMGVCLGGHLALRAGLNPLVRASVAYYPTDLHTSTLGAGKKDDTLRRLPESTAAFFFVFGRQDPHVPPEGRHQIHQYLDSHTVNFEWHEFNAAHAFLRDEGPRYDPSLARICLELTLRFFSEKLGSLSNAANQLLP